MKNAPKCSGEQSAPYYAPVPVCGAREAGQSLQSSPILHAMAAAMAPVTR